ncbi:MAG TPA: hypothetical protein VML01_02865 [Bryobacterales bacterium]|nr:hypothetical protein [Bryobacterales bacterium]
MPIEKVERDHNLRIQFPPPRRGSVEYSVEADVPVSTYVLDKQTLNEFDEGKSQFEAYGGFSRRKRHHQTVDLPGRRNWYLLIVNDNDEDAAVHYEVYD